MRGSFGSRFARTLLWLGVGAGFATAALASLLLGSPLGGRIVIPGDLTVAHASFSEDCTRCHAASFDATKGVLQGIVPSRLSLADSRKCLDCHSLGEHSLEAHGMPTALLEPLPDVATASAGGASNRNHDASIFSPPVSADGEYACMLCHQEHQGSVADLTAIGDARCQACHSHQIHAFEDDHPDFDRYPYERRLRIAFDHGSHIHQHFLAKDTGPPPTACTDCHTPDATGASMLTAGFDEACGGACHAREVAGRGRVDGSGVPFIVLPALDTLTLKRAGVGIGQWPADSAIAEGRITPFMELLLAGSPETAEDLSRVKELDLLDLRDASREDLDAVGRLVWAIKALLLELSADGHAALRERIEQSLGKEISPSSLASLAGGLSPSTVKAARMKWLPSLDAELTQHELGADPPLDSMESMVFDAGDSSEEDWVAAGGWYCSHADFSLRYRPQGHADTFLRSWLDLGAQVMHANPRVTPVFAALADSEAVGRCMKCHSVDAVSETMPKLNWTARSNHGSTRTLVKFSHAAHFPLLDDRGCQTCHRLNGGTPHFMDAYAQSDPSVFSSAFQHLGTDTCTTCHASRAADTRCLTCHEYHAQRPRTALRDAPLRLSGSEGEDSDSP